MLKYIEVSLFFILVCLRPSYGQETYIRSNLVGYLPQDNKVAMVMADHPLVNDFELKNWATKEIVYSHEPVQTSGDQWGNYPYQYYFDFSQVESEGSFELSCGEARARIEISNAAYKDYENDLLAFMRQQRCGYNPYYDEVCHQGDGRIFYAPVPDSTYFDFTGGWHDAGDQLKYLITGSNATARMLLAYELFPEVFDDIMDELGRPYPNGLPDILDEVKWGLNWILKLHPRQDWLIHQIADDRDHRGFKFPYQDNAEYGWGPNSYRAAYFATGEPQGLGKWKSKATGISNLAGRSAAALGMAARIWKELDLDPAFAERCKVAAVELYAMGKAREGYQQGNSHGAPYRYNEDSWEDDMEWGAAELFRLTGDEKYLRDAIYYANLIKDDGWMARDSMAHYQKYPFMNVGHFALYQVASDEVKTQLVKWYRANIEKVIARAKTNAYHIGVPFLWCSNNLLVNFITQVILYEKMTGDQQFHRSMLLHRDWLFGRNPWGTSMFTGIPRNGETPIDVHLPPLVLLDDTPAGGLVDGPIYQSIHRNLKGLFLQDPDEFAQFQNKHVVYHDDVGDYSTNEPTMDGTADAILLFAYLSKLSN